jgi:hypothetical protein
VLKPNLEIHSGVEEMSRLAFALFIATGLFFTAYFGTAAWRLSDDSHVEITGQIGR